MQTDIQERCDRIEASYEFMLSYAAQGLLTDEGSSSGKQLREQLGRMIEALRGLDASCVELIRQEQLAPVDHYMAYFEVLKRDARNALAVADLVLAQPSISSQLIDNLNASMHVRAVLADLFLITEILELRQKQAMFTLQADLNVHS
jgi:hypothetical protein